MLTLMAVTALSHDHFIANVLSLNCESLGDLIESTFGYAWWHMHRANWSFKAFTEALVEQFRGRTLPLTQVDLDNSWHSWQQQHALELVVPWLELIADSCEFLLVDDLGGHLGSGRGYLLQAAKAGPELGAHAH